ncbi:hypothetical protein ACFFUS_01355 [Vibrio gallaecicus]|uniref:hypothetical protein n=1 Tax=Vibrio TaxID=662 RepID=UPI0010C9A052|nr:hypothetical protein [Vibrio gallaecicus]MDN3613048.1 hypothetical protein [Vibrio gallaecicus]
MLVELEQLIDSKDVIVLSTPEETAVTWLLEPYKNCANIRVIEDAHKLDTTMILEACSLNLSESKKVILTAQFRSQLPVINIASLCNEKRKKLVNIELLGWNEEKAEPSSYSSF